MATLFSNLGSGSNPTMLYSVTASETDRTSTTVTYSVTVSARLEDQTYGYYNADVYPKIKMGSVTKSFATLGTFPKGAGTKTSTISLTVTGISATTSSVSYTFSATNELGGTSSSSTGYVSGKSGTASCTKYATTPSLSGSVTIKDGSTTVSSYYRENIGTGSFTVSWPAMTGANGTKQYELERSTNGGSWTDVSNSLTTTSTTHAPGSSTTSIRYRVRAKNIVGTDTMYSGWIYSSTVNRNVMTAPTLTSSASVSYTTKSFTLSLSAASDNLKSSMTYTLTATAGKYTTLNGSSSVSTGTITINTNNGTTGHYMTLDNMKTAALSGATHSDGNDYRGTIDLTVTANNGKGTTKTDTISIPIDLGKDAPVVGTPSVSVASTSYYSINSVNYIFPEFKPVSLTIPAAIKDALGRNCSFDVIMKEGSSEEVIKNTGTVTGATTPTVNHTEAGLLTAKKTVSFYVKAKTFNGLSASSTATPNVDLHYYKKPSVTSSSLSRITGSASFKVTITPSNSLTGATNTSTMPSGYAKGTSTTASGVESYTVSSNTTLLDTYTAKISVVVRDSIGYILKADGTNDVTLSITIPAFVPMLSIRELGVGINGFATANDKFVVGGNSKFNGDVKVGSWIYSNGFQNSSGYFEIGSYNSTYGEGKLQTFYNANLAQWNVSGRDSLNAGVSVTLNVSRINLGTSIYAAAGGGLDLNNSDVVGANSIWFSDTMTGSNEALQFPRDATPSGSTVHADYDSFRVYEGSGYLNDKVMFTSDNEILWSGGYYMNENQTITPSKPLSKCPNGWVLVWSEYTGSAPGDFDWNYSFIPKIHASDPQTGTGVWSIIGNDFDAITGKYCYITNTTVKGHAKNDDATGDRNRSCLRYVLSY